MATYGDVNPPSVLIENPQQMNDDGLFFLRGTASDDKDVKVVKIKVNNVWVRKFNETIKEKGENENREAANSPVPGRFAKSRAIT